MRGVSVITKKGIPLNRTLNGAGLTIGNDVYIDVSIIKSVQLARNLTGFPLKTCGNDKEKQPLKLVILVLAATFQSAFHIKHERHKIRFIG